MKESFGARMSRLRKERGLTQEALAEAVGVSPQAVSKWENDLSCPDILLLPQLAALLGVTADVLLSGDQAPESRLVPAEERKRPEEMMLHIYVNSGDGDRVKVNLPMAMVRLGLEIGMQMPQVNGNEALKGIDLAQVLAMVDQGLMGKLVEVETADGDVVEIVVE